MTRLHGLFLRIPLVIGFFYNAYWNSSDGGEIWWATVSGYPSWFRYVIAVAEIMAALSFASGRAMKIAGAWMAFIMLGAMAERFNSGFSYLSSGWEAPFLYFMLCLSIITLPNTKLARK